MNKSFLKSLLAPIAVLALHGCAFNDYHGTAQRSALANICEQEGFISYKEFAYYISFQMGEYPHQNMKQVDENKLRQMYEDEVEKLKRYNLKSSESQKNLRTACANVAVVAERVRPRNNIQPQQPSVATQVNQIGDSIRQGGNQALQQSNSYTAPTVAPINPNPLGGGKVRNCRIISGIEYCN